MACRFSVVKIPALLLVVIWALSLPIKLPGQDSVRLRRAVERLASPSMKGRGYLFNGHRKASSFLKKEFQKAGLRALPQGWFQEFPMAQNLFPVRPEVRIGNRRLQPGVHFLPGAAAPSVQGKFRLYRPDSLELARGIKGTGPMGPPVALVLPPKSRIPDPSLFRNGLVVRLQDKLTHTLSQNQAMPPVLELNRKALLPEDSVLEVNLKAELRENIVARNVLGWVPGTASQDSFLVLCAHYDHLGAIGKRIYFPGANDNASGVALLLELAHEISRRPLRWPVLFIAFSGEEAGLLGSFYFTEHPWIPLDRIRFVMNLDLMGFGETGATVVNGSVHPDLFSRLKDLNEQNGYLPELKVRGKAANSDHYPFSERGVPAFFLYSLGGPGHYHDVLDRPETLSLARMRGLFGLIRDFLKGF